MRNSSGKSAASSITVLLVDDHPIVTLALNHIISAENDMAVVGRADDGANAIQMYRVHRPDIVLMDLYMPGLSGLEALITIRSEFPNAVVIILSAYERPEDILQSVRNGAAGYILKDAPAETIIQAIRLGFNGVNYYSERIIGKLAEKLNGPELSQRELAVLNLMIEGLTYAEISAKLSISLGTVKHHMRNIYSKLGATSRTQAVINAVDTGLSSG